MVFKAVILATGVAFDGNREVRATLGQLDRFEEELAVYDRVARFGDAAEPALREWVSRAMGRRQAIMKVDRDD